MDVFFRLGKLALHVLLLYLLYALVASTVPHIRAKPVSEAAKEQFAQVQYRGEEMDGPDKIALIENTRQAFNARVELLREAEESLDIVYHTIQSGASTDAFLGEVAAAADRGVKIRILVDGKAGAMAPVTRRALRALNNHENVECRGYNPLRPLRPWEWHTLLHDKFIIMDGELVLLGGRNIGDRFFDPESYTGKVTDDREVLVWRTREDGDSVLPRVMDYMELLWNDPITGPFAKEKPGENSNLLQSLVEAAARLEESDPAYYTHGLARYKEEMLPTAKISLLANPIHAGQKEPWVGHQLGILTREATDTVLIQTPYATANKYLLGMLTDAAEVADATMLINSMAGSPNFPAFSNYYYNRKKFLRTGVDIYEYQSEHSIHGKSMVFDGRISAVGSFNLDDRSMYIDTETMLVIDSPAFAEELTGAIHHYMDSSLQVGEDNRYVPDETVEPVPVSSLKKGLMFFVSLFSRLVQFLI